jgi:ATP-dependent Clp protease protease subunit
MGDVMISNGSTFFDKVFEEHLEKRKVIINGEITEDIVETAMLQILKWNDEDKDKTPESRQPIELIQNSPGGNVSDGLVLCNIIENSITPVYITTLGTAASMAAYIAMCGTKGKRKCYEFTTFLIHSGSMVVAGNSDEVESTVKYYSDMRKEIEQFIYKHTKIDKDTYKQHQKEEWYLTSREAKRWGLVDEIIGVTTQEDN